MPTVAVTTQPTYNVGPITGFKAKGTIQGVDGEFKDDLLVQGDLEVVGTLYTDLVSFGDDLELADGKDLTMHADGTGTFGTGAGAVSLNGSTTVASTKTLAVTTADNLTVGGVIIPQKVVVTAQYKASDVDHTIFIANNTYTVTGIKYMVEVVDTAGGAATVQIVKCTGTTAPSSGAAVSASAVSIKIVTQTVTIASLSATGADLILVAGDRLAFKFSGNTDGTGIVMVELKRT